jgi:hypothetical protein
MDDLAEYDHGMTTPPKRPNRKPIYGIGKDGKTKLTSAQLARKTFIGLRLDTVRSR